jgi:hypothetical protein
MERYLSLTNTYFLPGFSLYECGANITVGRVISQTV